MKYTKPKQIIEQKNYQETKEEILFKHLSLGYNAKLARSLALVEVIDPMEMWATRSGVAAGDISCAVEFYDDLLGTTVATVTTHR